MAALSTISSAIRKPSDFLTSSKIGLNLTTNSQKPLLQLDIYVFSLLFLLKTFLKKKIPLQEAKMRDRFTLYDEGRDGGVGNGSASFFAVVAMIVVVNQSVAKLNNVAGIYEPYLYQLPLEELNHNGGVADI